MAHYFSPVYVFINLSMAFLLTTSKQYVKKEEGGFPLPHMSIFLIIFSSWSTYKQHYHGTATSSSFYCTCNMYNFRRYFSGVRLYIMGVYISF